MSCRIDQYSVLIESSSTQSQRRTCVNMGVRAQNLSREGKCIKFQFSVYLIYQNMYQLAAISAPIYVRLNHKAILKPLRYHKSSL